MNERERHLEREREAYPGGRADRGHPGGDDTDVAWDPPQGGSGVSSPSSTGGDAASTDSSQTSSSEPGSVGDDG